MYVYNSKEQKAKSKKQEAESNKQDAKSNEQGQGVNPREKPLGTIRECNVTLLRKK